MDTKEILKEAFDSDMEVLKKALDSDQKLLDICTKWKTDSLVKIGILIDILVSKNIMTLEEAKRVFYEVEDEKEEESDD